jgi:type IV pilus assembly protein PilY1
MELDAQTGSRLSYSALDLSGDKKFNEDDEVSIDVVIDGENTTIRVPISGIKFTEGIVKTPAVISDGALEYKIASGSTGGVAVITEKGSLTPPRTSWRQLQ